MKKSDKDLSKDGSPGTPDDMELDASSLDQVAGGCGCEFPAQNIELTRKVDITNTIPPTEFRKTDECGNIIP